MGWCQIHFGVCRIAGNSHFRRPESHGIVAIFADREVAQAE